MPQNLPFKILGISHIGIAPKSGDVMADFFKSILGLPHIADETVEDQKTHTIMFDSQHGSDEPAPPSGSGRVELLLPSPEGEGPIAKFLENRGGGVHHLALKVDDIESALKYLKSQDIALIDETPRIGAGGHKIAFIHPKATGGLLLELTQE